MEKKYQFFISSTYIDLVEERKEVIQAILELDCIPVGMELFPAANEDQWTLIKELIDSCDYYLLIVGGRYGSLNSEGISYTQMEYDYALKKGIPVIAFTPANPDEISVGKTDKDPEKTKKLTAFLDIVQQKMCKSYENAKDLGSVASRSIIKLIKKHPAIGWVRANQLTSAESSKEILDLRKQVEELENKLYKQKNFAPVGTETLEQGTDIYKLKYHYVQNQWESMVNSDDGSIEFTWDEVFSVLSPLMVDEAPEDGLKNEIVKIIREQIKEKENHRPSKVEVNGTDFQTIKVQLIALGLIEKSDKKRSIKDTDVYWKLTPFGEKKMMGLKAIRKKNEG
jgi:hypothetical protein